MIKTRTIPKKCKNFLAGAFLATGLFGNTLNAQTVSGAVEVMSADKNMTLDTKLSLDVNKKVNIFARNRTTFDYELGEKKPFTLVDVSYNWKNGLGILSETQFVDNGNPDQRFGLQYFKKMDNLSLYLEGTMGKVPRANGEILAKVRYARPLNAQLEGIMQLETITDFNVRGVTFATQRCRLGLGVGKHLEFGIASDITEVPLQKKINASYTLGG